MAFRRKRSDTKVSTIETTYGVDFGVRGDMTLGTLLARTRAASMTSLLRSGGKRRLEMARPRAFISFDFDNDSDIKLLLAGQAKHPDSPFDFTDASVKEHLTGDWREKVRRRMDNVDVVIVLCGQRTHTAAGVAAELAIAQERGKSYFLLRGYADKNCTVPTTAKVTDKIYDWTWENLKLLIHGSR